MAYPVTHALLCGITNSVNESRDSWLCPQFHFSQFLWFISGPSIVLVSCMKKQIDSLNSKHNSKSIVIILGSKYVEYNQKQMLKAFFSFFIDIEKTE